MIFSNTQATLVYYSAVSCLNYIPHTVNVFTFCLTVSRRFAVEMAQIMKDNSLFFFFFSFLNCLGWMMGAQRAKFASESSGLGKFEFACMGLN